MGWIKAEWSKSIGSGEHEKLSYSLLRDHRAFLLSPQSEIVPTKDLVGPWDLRLHRDAAAQPGDAFPQPGGAFPRPGAAAPPNNLPSLQQARQPPLHRRQRLAAALLCFRGGGDVEARIRLMSTSLMLASTRTLRPASWQALSSDSFGSAQR